jgi:hypothetical protein
LRFPVFIFVLAVALPGGVSSQDRRPIQFADGTRYAELDFRHDTGAFGKKFLPETMGSGCAFLDYDGDGWLDAFLVNLTSWPGQPAEPTYSALYRNDRDGTFTEVTREAGLEVAMYGMGVAAADYDNDGWTDLYVTAVGGSHLFRNLGDGSFEDVTEEAGARGPESFPTSAMFFDYDRDGQLRHLVDRRGPLLHARREDQVLLHPRVLQGREPDAPAQPGRRDLRGRDEGGEPVEPRLQGPRRGPARPRS